MNNMKEFLRNHHYEVKVEVLPTGCTATFPIKIQQPPMINCCYYYTIDKGKLLVDLDVKDLPNYAIRPFILADLIAKCRKFNYNPLLMTFYSDKKEIDEETFFQIVPVTHTKASLQKEILLRMLLVNAMQTNFSEQCDIQAKTNGIIRGYQICKNVFLNQSKI